MIHRNTRVSVKSTLGICAVVAAASLFGPAAVGRPAIARAERHEDHRAWHVSGDLHSHAVPCGAICTAGTLTGDLAGTFDFTMLTMNPLGPPNMVVYTGIMTYHTAKGDISGPDVGYWNLSTGEFIDTTDVTSGTEDLEGATGKVVIQGDFDPVTGVGNSRYHGVVFTDSCD